MNDHDLAQEGVEKIKAAIVSLLGKHPDGLTNAQVTQELGLQSDQNGKQINYLAWSVLGLLMGSKRVIREERLYKLL